MSVTVWKGSGKERIDVENPSPGKRAGQIHYQDNSGNKYLYDQIKNEFVDAPNSVNKLPNTDSMKKAIKKAMENYLGEQYENK